MNDQLRSISINPRPIETPTKPGWTVERITSLMAGVMVLLTLTLSRLNSDLWLLLTGYVAANLMFNGVAGWCPMGVLLHRLGVPRAAERGESCAA